MNLPTPSGNEYKKCQRYNLTGHAHSLTFSCFHGQPFLSHKRTRQWMIAAMDQARHRLDLALWAYVIMPEHVHLLIWPKQEEYSMSRILYCLKVPVANRALKLVREKSPQFLSRMSDPQAGGNESLRFWQRGGGYDRNLWTPGAISETIDYIHNNPVRRGLAESPLDWECSSARAYAGRADAMLSIDFETLPIEIGKNK